MFSAKGFRHIWSLRLKSVSRPGAQSYWTGSQKATLLGSNSCSRFVSGTGNQTSLVGYPQGHSLQIFRGFSGGGNHSELFRDGSVWDLPYQNIIVEPKDDGHVGLITLNRPKALNALNADLLQEMLDALDKLERDDTIGAIVITGSDKAFAAGADIKMMATKTYAEVQQTKMLAAWEHVSQKRKPIIAAVNGYALGGGCELAMMCDFIIAGDKAVFAQPEITLGTIPGMGGTQRLTRLVGKAKAMEMILTGCRMDAEGAERAGLAARVVPAGELVSTAIETASTIARFSRPVVALAKEAVNTALETSLQQGLLAERTAFYGTFALEDQKEGMSAFAEKRKPEWRQK